MRPRDREPCTKSRSSKVGEICGSLLKADLSREISARDGDEFTAVSDAQRVERCTPAACCSRLASSRICADRGEQRGPPIVISPCVVDFLVGQRPAVVRMADEVVA